MDYTYLAIAGAVLLIFLSIYFFVVEKNDIRGDFAGCTKVSGPDDCVKGVYTYNKFTLKDPSDGTSDMDFETKLCCTTKRNALAADVAFNQLALGANTQYLNKRLGITSSLTAGGDLGPGKMF